MYNKIINYFLIWEVGNQIQQMILQIKTRDPLQLWNGHQTRESIRKLFLINNLLIKFLFWLRFQIHETPVNAHANEIILQNSSLGSAQICNFVLNITYSCDITLVIQ